MKQSGDLQLKEAVVFVSGNPEASEASLKELKDAGFEVNVIKEAANAIYLEEVKPKNWKPSFFIVDVVLPQMSGFELTRRILSRYNDGKVPVILMAQHRSAEDLLEARQSGAVALLPKPVAWKDVKSELEKYRQKRLSEASGIFSRGPTK